MSEILNASRTAQLLKGVYVISSWHSSMKFGEISTYTNSISIGVWIKPGFAASRWPKVNSKKSRRSFVSLKSLTLLWWLLKLGILIPLEP